MDYENYKNVILMDILLIAKIFLIIAFTIFTIAAIRLTTHKSTSNAIIGADAITVSVSVILVIFGNITGVGFYKDIALALILIGVVGTISFTIVLRGE